MQKRMITNERGEIEIRGDGGRYNVRRQVLMDGMELRVRGVVFKVLKMNRTTGNKAVARIQMVSQPEGRRVRLGRCAIIVR